MDAQFWNERYAATDFFYGQSPNDFVAQVADQIPAGPVLCLAEGEGRNAAFLAQHGHSVTAVDQSETGLAKARQLAASRGCSIETLVADLAHFVVTPMAWSGIVATFMHLPQPLRAQVHAGVVAGLKPGGVYILEAYTPDQLKHATGGPRDIALLMTLDMIRQELAGLDLEIAQEIERDVVEGTGHKGRAAVLQILGRRRA